MAAKATTKATTKATGKPKNAGQTIRRLLDQAPPYADIARAAADERSWDQTASLLEQVYRSVIDQPR